MAQRGVLLLYLAEFGFTLVKLEIRGHRYYQAMAGGSYRRTHNLGRCVPHILSTVRHPTERGIKWPAWQAN